MRITIGRNTEVKMKLLGIKDYPFSATTLKSNYRTKLFESHPDKGGSKEKVIEVIKAYEYLFPLAVDVTESDKAKAKKKIDKSKEDLFDLTKKCESCNGTGEVIIPIDITIETCWDCGSNIGIKDFVSFLFGMCNTGRGYHEKNCEKCDGIGFIKGSICKHCNGYGKFRQKCVTCNGTGLLKVVQESRKENCSHCKGVGRVELDLFNPVIPKGAVL